VVDLREKGVYVNPSIGINKEVIPLLRISLINPFQDNLQNIHDI
jgi:hypothetical protein